MPDEKWRYESAVLKEAARLQAAGRSPVEAEEGEQQPAQPNGKRRLFFGIGLLVVAFCAGYVMGVGHKQQPSVKPAPKPEATTATAVISQPTPPAKPGGSMISTLIRAWSDMERLSASTAGTSNSIAAIALPTPIPSPTPEPPIATPIRSAARESSSGIELGTFIEPEPEQTPEPTPEMAISTPLADEQQQEPAPEEPPPPTPTPKKKTKAKFCTPDGRCYESEEQMREDQRKRYSIFGRQATKNR